MLFLTIWPKQVLEQCPRVLEMFVPKDGIYWPFASNMFGLCWFPMGIFTILVFIAKQHQSVVPIAHETSIVQGPNNCKS